MKLLDLFKPSHKRKTVDFHKINQIILPNNSYLVFLLPNVILIL
jgi:hypothetical protein